jgi:hypothetical protein
MYLELLLNNGMYFIHHSKVPLQSVPLTEDRVKRDMSKNTPALTITGFDALMMARGSRVLNSGVWLYQSML